MNDEDARAEVRKLQRTATRIEPAIVVPARTPSEAPSSKLAVLVRAAYKGGCSVADFRDAIRELEPNERQLRLLLAVLAAEEAR